MNIIVDTREQRPLWTGKTKKKLLVGDYTTDKLEGKVHIERKSPGDLYGSIIQDHERFRREIIRAQENNIQLVIMVECSEKDFYAKRWPGGYQLRCKGNVLAKIVATIRKKYNIDFIWCEGRNDMKKTATLFLEAAEIMKVEYPLTFKALADL